MQDFIPQGGRQDSVARARKPSHRERLLRGKPRSGAPRQVARADRETTDLNERQSVITSAGDALRPHTIAQHWEGVAEDVKAHGHVADARGCKGACRGDHGDQMFAPR